jgi:hypothetical protein
MVVFLKTARQLESVTQSMASVPEIKQAFAIANQANLSAEEMEEMEHQKLFIQDQRNFIKKTFSQGMEYGKLETQLVIAPQFLNVLDDVAISHITWLAIEVIFQLRQTNS